MAMTNDPFAVAVEVAERGNFMYGQIQVTAQFVALQKGVGKSTFIDGVHKPEDRRTEITFVLNPIEQSGMTQLITRSMLAESAEWTRIVWPSLRDGCKMTQVRELDNKFAKIELVKNGRKWNDKNTGEEREGTTMKFHAVYKDQAACVTAYLADGNSVRDNNDTNNSDGAAAMAVDMTPNADNPERSAMLQFLPALIKQANGNTQMLDQLLNSMPMIKKYFNLTSPEVQQLLNAA